MFLYIAIVFIAELIILTALVAEILKLDRKVTALNAQIIQEQAVIKDALCEIRKTISTVREKINSAFNFAKDKKQQFSTKAILSVVSFLLPLLLKGKYRKLAMLVQFILEVRKYVR